MADLNSLFAEEYDNTKSYTKGDKCVFEKQWYKCIEATTGEFDETKWEKKYLVDYMGGSDLNEIYYACVYAGSTPNSKTIGDIVEAIKKLGYAAAEDVFATISQIKHGDNFKVNATNIKIMEVQCPSGYGGNFRFVNATDNQTITTFAINDYNVKTLNFQDMGIDIPTLGISYIGDDTSAVVNIIRVVTK